MSRGKYRIPHLLLAVTAVATLGIGSCRALLPERFAVNAPLRNMLFGTRTSTPSQDEVDTRFRAPDGFAVSLYAADIPPTARALRFTAGGDLLVSTPRSDSIQLLTRDENGDGRADGMRELIGDLNGPHGIDIRDGWLYVGETDAIGRIRFDEQTGEVRGDYTRIVRDLPGGGNHWKKTVHFGPDGWLYVNVGSSCNVCIEDDERRATIMRFRADGSDGEIVARGLRNSAGFDWRPESGALYATDNGRDMLGNDFPPCELNRIVPGGFYGWPIANGDRVPDPDYGAGQTARIEASIPPEHSFRAHNAPLGITFIRGVRVPAEYRGAALVALHGSWNRTEKDGYKVVSLHWQPDGTILERDFFVGFEVDEDVAGRPAYVAEGPDGAFYVSDDYAGVVWRIAWGESQEALARPPAPAPGDPLALFSAAERTALSAEGRALYALHACATCHEPDAAPPGTTVKLLENLPARYSVPTLAQLLARPPSPMPTYPLTPEQRRALSVHLLER